VDESQPAADTTNGAARGGRQPEAAQHHPAGADQPVGPEPRPAHHAPAESATARPLHSTTDGREKQEAEGKAFRADVTDRSEQITKKYAALRNAQDDLPEQIPPQVMKRLMRNAIDNKDMVTQLALLDEEIRRTKGYRLTWTQLIAGRGLIDGTLDQPAGEGKTEAFDFAAVHHALSGDGSMLRLTSSRTLAGRDAADFAALARRFDIRVETVDHNVRIQKRYRPTVYVSDVNELGFYHNRWGEKVPTDVLRVDEVDTLDPDKVFIQSTGNDKLAGSAITDRVDWVHNAISEHRFTDEDFGPNGRLTEGGQSKLRDRLQADGSAFERARGEARRYNGFEDARNRLEQAQAAGRLKEGKDYLIYRGPDRNQPERLVIIDQATGEPLYDANTNLEQRWEKGLAQAVEKKHGIDVHADAESTKPLTLKQVLDEYSNKGGASGTAEPHAEVLKELGFKDVTKIYRLNRPRLEQHPDSVHATEEDAFEGMVDDIVRNHFQPDEDGILQYVPDKQPTQVIVHRNDWIDSGNGASKLKVALIARGIPDE
jgi:preprotein translocase subunit SecA